MLPIKTLHITYLYGRIALFFLVQKCYGTVINSLRTFSAFTIYCLPVGETNPGPISLQREPCQGIKYSVIKFCMKKILRYICSYWWILENAYGCWIASILPNLFLYSFHHCQRSDFQRSFSWVLPWKVLWFRKIQLLSLWKIEFGFSVQDFSSVWLFFWLDGISFCTMIFYAHDPL